MNTDRRRHWDEVYETKKPDQVSWTQEIPTTSLDFIHASGLPKSAKIIDIGGGDGNLADFLLDEGFENITVLDISAMALDKAKKRLGYKAVKIKWIVSDVTDFMPETEYDLWHDRATFHFLTSPGQVSKYLDIARKCVKGYMVLGTFSENGPKKCSGLDVRQYSEDSLSAELKNGFEKVRCLTEDHKTPFGTLQNFLFCSFKRKSL